jgi:hypothetical protein
MPLLIGHTGQPWPEDALRLASLISDPLDELAGHIPDFGLERCDLHRYSDDPIKGTIMSRVVLLLFHYSVQSSFAGQGHLIESLF